VDCQSLGNMVNLQIVGICNPQSLSLSSYVMTPWLLLPLSIGLHLFRPIPTSAHRLIGCFAHSLCCIAPIRLSFQYRQCHSLNLRPFPSALRSPSRGETQSGRIVIGAVLSGATGGGGAAVFGAAAFSGMSAGGGWPWNRGTILKLNGPP